jgi:hypothetical protein
MVGKVVHETVLILSNVIQITTTAIAEGWKLCLDMVLRSL